MILPHEIEKLNLEITVNGRKYKRTVPTHMRLLDFIRNELRLTGTKEVCGEGECGACTVIMNGRMVNSCLIFAVEAHGAEIITIEGLTDGDSMTELQQAFVDHHSVQCGYCIPGMIMSGEQILKDNRHPNENEIRSGLSGNICRCTGYHKIVEAIDSIGKIRR